MDYIITFECPNMESVLIMARMARGDQAMDAASYVFNPHIPLHDEHRGHRELWLSHADFEGGTALAIGCYSSDEAERRVKLYVSMEADIIDTQPVKEATQDESDPDFWTEGYLDGTVEYHENDWRL